MPIARHLALAAPLALAVLAAPSARAADRAPVDRAPANRAPAEHASERALVLAEPLTAFGMRRFDYTDRLTGGLRSYDLGAAVLLGGRVEVQPLALFGARASDALGLEASYARSVGLSSATAPDQLAPPSVDTSWRALDAALRARVHLGDRVTLGARGGYGALDFAFTGAGDLARELPSVAYRFVRLGLEARVDAAPFVLEAGVDDLALTSAGAAADRFPRAKVGGVEARAAIALRVAPHVEARTGARYQRFFYAMRSALGDAYLAGGALDELGVWETGVAFFY